MYKRKKNFYYKDTPMVLYKDLLSQARIRKLSFYLTYENYINLIYKACIYCGNGPNKFIIYKKYTGIKGNGIDRINSDLGYTNENCVPCCYICNNMKNALSLEDFKIWLSKVKLSEKINEDFTI